jgi:hypothetical protein
MKKTILLWLVIVAFTLKAQDTPMGGSSELYIEQLNFGAQESVTWRMEAIGVVWDCWDHPLYIAPYSNGVYDLQNIFIGTITREMFKGFNSRPFEPGINFAIGLYRISLSCSTAGIDPASNYIYVDFRDCRYTTEYSGGPGSVDIRIRYDKSDGTFYWNNKVNQVYTPLANGETIGIWRIKGKEAPITSGFQPTTPTNLTVTSENEHPRLNWSASTPDSVRYYVYRGNTQIALTPLASPTYLDEEVRAGSGAAIYYKVRAISADGTKPSPDFSNTASIEGRFESEKKMPNVALKKREIENKFSAYPNPFNPATNISVQTKEDGHLSVAIFNVYGQQVAELAKGYYTAGTYQFAWDAGHTANGVYVCRMMTRNQAQAMKLILMK